MSRRQRDALALLAVERDGLRQTNEQLRTMLERERLAVERARRAGGPWPEPLPDVRTAVDREESERRAVALTEAITERLRQDAARLAEVLFRPGGGSR